MVRLPLSRSRSPPSSRATRVDRSSYREREPGRLTCDMSDGFIPFDSTTRGRGAMSTSSASTAVKTEDEASKKCPSGILSGPGGWCDSPIYMLAVGQGRTFQSFKAHLSVLQGSTFLAAKCGLPATRESKMISLPEEDPVVVGHIVNFLYTKTATPDDFREMINTYLCAGQKYHILDLKALLLQKIGTFQVADNPTRAADFFGACSEVYKEMAKPDDDFRTIFRALAQGMFGSLMGSMNWPRTLAPYLSRGGAMAEDIFSAQHGALKASSRTAQPASTQVQPAQHPVVQNTHYVQTLKKEMQAAQDSIARIRKKHDQTHRGCNCAGSHRPRANERHR